MAQKEIATIVAGSEMTTHTGRYSTCVVLNQLEDGRDRLYPLLRGLWLGPESPVYLIGVEQKFVAHVAVFNRLQIPCAEKEET
jgi:hypothetical protein